MKGAFIEFLKTVALFVWGAVAVITSAAVWNGHPGALVGIVAGVALLLHGVCIYVVARALFTKKKE